MDKIVKIGILLGSLLAGLGVFYHYVIFLPGVEQRKTEQIEASNRQAEAEKAEAEKREVLRLKFYEACKQDATSTYIETWASACKAVANEKKSKLQICLNDRSIIENQFMGEAYCKKNYGDIDPSPECSLPSSRADSIEQNRKDRLERCLSEAKNGL